MTAVAVGFGNSLMFWVFGTIFYVGALLVDDGTLTFLQFFQSFFAVVLGAFGVGQARLWMMTKYLCRVSRAIRICKPRVMPTIVPNPRSAMALP